ncbi:MAG: J domain-containing protein [Candidatus Scalindua sp.]
MAYTITKTNLINDCYLLFGSEIFNYVDFLKDLSPSELKTAYRKKAFETHPDRARSLGKSEYTMDERFKKVITAYERLNSVVQGGEIYILRDVVPKKENATRTNPRTQTRQESTSGFSYTGNVKKTKREHMMKKRASDRFYNGNVPKRELLIGQFLYYSGLISWKTLFDAVYWQRKRRPIIGKIALDWGILSSDDIRRILTERNYKEQFGEYALRKGFITHFEHIAIIGRQKKLQPPIGEYFIQQGLLANTVLKKMVEGLKNHNSKVLKRARGFFSFRF